MLARSVREGEVGKAHDAHLTGSNYAAGSLRAERTRGSSLMMIISTMVRWWRSSRVAAGIRLRTFDEIQELSTEESDATDLVRMDDDGWQLLAAPSISRQR
jgi:hypothetical protein